MILRPISKELQSIAVRELNEVPNRVEEDINYVTGWANKQPHLNINTDPQMIIAFLRGNKFDFEKTKKRLDKYYSMRNIAPKLLCNKNPFLPEIQEIMNKSSLVRLRDESNPAAPVRYLFRAANSDPEKHRLESVVKLVLMESDYNLYNDDRYVINGQEVILDLQGSAYSYVSQLTPTLLKCSVTLVQNAYPFRVKGIHIINIPSFAQFFIAAFKSLLSNKIGNRIFCYPVNDFDSLYKNIPRDVFPEEYGGRAGTISKLSQELKDRLESFHGWFEQDSVYCSDESKRPGKQTHSDQFFNMEGTFRKLEID